MCQMTLKNYFNDKYNRLEVSFFLIYYLFFPIFSSLEYNLIEMREVSFLVKNVPDRLIYGCTSMLSGLFFYKVLIQGYLFKKKYVVFAIAIPIFLILLNFYTLFTFFLVSKLSILPEQMITYATRWYNSNALIHFSVIYMFREFLVLTALAYFIKSARQDRHIGELAKQQLSAELLYLRTQIQPHFFFNTLNNIYALTLQRSEKAAPLVARHADIMRYMLYAAPQSTVTLQQEVDFLKDYIQVEAIRYPEGITIDFDAQGIDQTALIEPLLLLPFIENTFKHGIREEAETGFVKIILSQMERELSLEVSNSKSANIGISGKPGIGLRNVRQRLDLLYSGAYAMIIADEKECYTVCLTITLKSK